MRHTLVYSLRGLAFVRVRLWLTLNMSFGKSSQSQKYLLVLSFGFAHGCLGTSQEPKNLSFLPCAVKEVDPSHFVRSVLLLYLKLYTHISSCMLLFIQSDHTYSTPSLLCLIFSGVIASSSVLSINLASVYVNTQQNFRHSSSLIYCS